MEFMFIKPKECTNAFNWYKALADENKYLMARDEKFIQDRQDAGEVSI